MKPRTGLVALFAGSALPPAISLLFLGDVQVRSSVLLSALVSMGGFALAGYLIPLLSVYTARAGLVGKDINKRGTPAGELPVPESLGLAVGVVFLICLVVFQFLHLTDPLAALGSPVFAGLGHQGLDEWLKDYFAAMATITFMVLLGFADDVMDFRWRAKLAFPLVAALPLLSSYGGGTAISLPVPACDAMGLPHGSQLELGPIYYCYMVALVVFCTNSINILAGVNGLEAGQTLVIASAVLLLNLSTLAGAPGTNAEHADGHLYSAYLMVPLMATTAALLVHNWYPSKVFVGDTFTYFAGTTIAVAGILGHFSETLLVFFIPQILNFLYSVPQLFGLVHCPRHRLPKFDPKTGLLTGSNDLNLVNLTLRLLGPCTEYALCMRLLVFQGLCCVGGFALRSAVAGSYKA